MYGPVLLETAPNYTKGGKVMLLVSHEYPKPEDRVLVIDDFLATGHTLRALGRIVKGAEVTLVGFDVVVEKSFEGGRELLKNSSSINGVPIHSLVTITSMDDGKIEFA